MLRLRISVGQPSLSGTFNKISLDESRKEPSPFVTPEPQPMTGYNTRGNRSRTSSATKSAIQGITTKKSSMYIPVSDGNKPLNLDVAKFISNGPVPLSSLPISPTESGLPLTEKIETEDFIELLLFRHTSLTNIFQSRLNQIRCVREVWDEAHVKPAVEMMVRTRDSSLWVDLLRILNLRPRLLTLDIAVLLLPLLKDLLFEVFEDYILTACDTIKLLAKSFSGVIMSSLYSPEFSGIDLSREER
jgi:katanin p80 WD40 repeat-containing subunit B1